MNNRNPFYWLTMEPDSEYYLVGTLPDAVVIGIKIKSDHIIDFNVWYAITGLLYNGGIIIVPPEGMTAKDVIKHVCRDMTINVDDYQQITALPEDAHLRSWITSSMGSKPKQETKSNWDITRRRRSIL